MTRCQTIAVMAVLLCAALAASASADVIGKEDYQANCVECHGPDGKGNISEKRMVPGYVSVDLTQLSMRAGGEYPRQQVYDTIDGRKRFAAHYHGDMPRWGSRYELGRDGVSPEGEAEIRSRISALVDYIETLHEK